MNSKERILAAWNGQAVDRIPLTTWCFGFPAPPGLQWQIDGVDRPYWYSLRMEHIHTLPQPWTLADEFQRVLAWRQLGVDDVLDISPPWSSHPAVRWEDQLLPAGKNDPCPLAIRQYHTPLGELRHAVRLTGETPGAGWVIQPDQVFLFEDFNIPRGFKHLVASPDDIPAVSTLYQAPDAPAQAAYRQRMEQVSAWARRENVPVQAWSAFGMDGVVWLTGVQNALFLALDAPQAFQELVETIFKADIARTELALATPGVDLIVQRGWYSSTNFWSPRLFERFVFPYLQALAALVHRHQRKLGYVMTTGVQKLGPRLADAGVDVLYFADPLQDHLPLDWARDHLSERMCLVGGCNALTLASSRAAIFQEVRHAIEVLGPTRRFILHPLDAIFPDTPWEGLETLLQAWNELG